MPDKWVVPLILLALSVFLLVVWIPVVKENRKRKR